MPQYILIVLVYYKITELIRNLAETRFFFFPYEVNCISEVVSAHASAKMQPEYAALSLIH